MAVGRYFQPTPYEGKLYSPPIDLLAGALEQAQKQYDTNFLATEKLRNKYIQALPNDRARANQLQKDFEGEIDSIVAKYNGDYGAATSDLYKLTSKMSKAFSPGGEAFAIQSNFDMAQESLKRERERLAEGEIISAQLNLLQNSYNNAPATTFNKDTGAYSQLSPIDLAKYVDEGKIGAEVLNRLPARKRKVERLAGIGPNGDYQYVTEEVEWKDPNEAVAALDQELFSNDAYQTYVRQMADFNGVDPLEFSMALRQDYIQRVVPARTGVMSESQTNKFVDNWQARKRMDLSNSLALEAAKQKNRKEMEAIKNGAQSGNTPPALLAIQRGSGDGQLPDIPKEMPDGFFGTIGNWLTGGKNDQPTSVSKLIKDAESGQKLPFSINVGMLKSIKAANPTLGDSDIIELYNRAKETVHSYGEIHYDPYETTAVQKEEAQRLLPVLSTGRTVIQRVDPDTGQVVELEPDQRLSFYADMQKAAKAKSPLFTALGKSRTNTGKVNYGTVLPDPNGERYYYVVKENRTDIERVQTEQLDKLFKFIQDPLRQTSDVTHININGQAVPVMGYKHYDNGQPNVQFYIAKRDASGRWAPDVDNPESLFVNRDQFGRPYALGPAEMEKLILPQSAVYSTFPKPTRPKYENEIMD